MRVHCLPIVGGRYCVFDEPSTPLPLCHDGTGDDRHFGTERVGWFNGGLFDSDAVLPLETGEIELVYEASALDWSQVEPSVLGTLFEEELRTDVPYLVPECLDAGRVARGSVRRISTKPFV